MLIAHEQHRASLRGHQYGGVGVCARTRSQRTRKSVVPIQTTWQSSRPDPGHGTSSSTTRRAASWLKGLSHASGYSCATECIPSWGHRGGPGACPHLGAGAVRPPQASVSGTLVLLSVCKRGREISFLPDPLIMEHGAGSDPSWRYRYEVHVERSVSDRRPRGSRDPRDGSQKNFCVLLCHTCILTHRRS